LYREEESIETFCIAEEEKEEEELKKEQKEEFQFAQNEQKWMLRMSIWAAGTCSYTYMGGGFLRWLRAQKNRGQRAPRN